MARAQEDINKQTANEAERIKNFGKVMPVMHAHAFGGQMVMVNNRVYKSPEKSTFTNFLISDN